MGQKKAVAHAARAPQLFGFVKSTSNGVLLFF